MKVLNGKMVNEAILFSHIEWISMRLDSMEMKVTRLQVIFSIFSDYLRKSFADGNQVGPYHIDHENRYSSY